MKMFLLVFFGILIMSSAVHAQQQFKIEVIRTKVVEMVGALPDGTTKKGKAVIGDLGLNGQNMGATVENAELRIPAGTYKGLLKYISKKGHVAGPLGMLGNEGDFLIDIDVQGRSGILFHGGNRPWHSTGCILLGAVSKRDGVKFLPDDHPLRALRKAFYGKEMPIETPNKDITIVIQDVM
jgi:hypothetical protein